MPKKSRGRTKNFASFLTQSFFHIRVMDGIKTFHTDKFAILDPLCISITSEVKIFIL